MHGPFGPEQGSVAAPPPHDAAMVARAAAAKERSLQRFIGCSSLRKPVATRDLCPVTTVRLMSFPSTEPRCLAARDSGCRSGDIASENNGPNGSLSLVAP